ncbi:hypothetical protein M569_11007, partial [Genlisea aurea]
MDRAMSLTVKVEELSDDSSASGSDGDILITEEINTKSLPCLSDEVWLFRRAKSYQDYMSLIPIPMERGTLLPCQTWWDLGNSLKKMYGQPLHYLTNVHLNYLDRHRIGSKDEHVPLYMTLHPAKAEASLWIIEEAHRKTTSPHHLLKLWQADSGYHRFIDPVFPKL